MSTEHDYQPETAMTEIPVRVTNWEGAPRPEARRRPRKALVARTYVLNAADPIQTILPQNRNRIEAWIVTATNDITIGPSRSDLQIGGGAAATIPHTDAVPFPMNTTDAVHATAVTLPTTVSVISVIEEP